MFKKGLFFITITAIVVGFSILSVTLWGGKSEEVVFKENIIISGTMTIQEFGEKNALSRSVLKEIFGLRDTSELNKTLSLYGSDEEVKLFVDKKLTLMSEGESKNWLKIPLKFGLWLLFVFGIFFYFRKHRMTDKIRIILLSVSVVIFGIVLGSDPGPMGTVKDALVLYGAKKVVFIPRMIAMIVFLFMVFIVNKFICAWGCQLGVLQDLLYRITNSNKFNNQKLSFKIPFAVTNTIRVLFFVSMVGVAFIWAIDLIGFIDPFKIFHPTVLSWASIAFIVVILFMSMLVYRPWCHLFCPFGLIGWVVEKLSVVKISVNYEKCIACNKCVEACPSKVMEAILKNEKKTIPDCFACYSCREVCPVGAIDFSAKKRSIPPKGHFNKKAI